MSLEDVVRRQQELALKEDLMPYAGQWVALRNGYVVASAFDPITLRADEAVRKDDALMPVPLTRGPYFF